MCIRDSNGRGVPQDRAEAAKWFRKAADQGLPRAQYLLALLLKDGMNDPPDDLPQASLLLQSAADNGYKEAQNELGVMYEQGVGKKQSYTEAIRWYQLAAAQGAVSYTHLDVYKRQPVSRQSPLGKSSSMRASRPSSMGARWSAASSAQALSLIHI